MISYFSNPPLVCTLGASVKIPFAEIAQNGNQYHFTDDTWLTATGFINTAPVEAELTVRRKAENRAEVQGTLHTSLRLTCDRCLATYEVPIATTFHLVLEVPDEEESWSVKALAEGTDIELLELDKPVADLIDILQQQLYLSLPMKQVCAADCQGLCPGCGVNLNSGTCTCAGSVENSPFAVLAALKKK